MNRPYIVRFENQTDANNFDVVIAGDTVPAIKEWAQGYFGPLTYVTTSENSLGEFEITFRRTR